MFLIRPGLVHNIIPAFALKSPKQKGNRSCPAIRDCQLSKFVSSLNARYESYPSDSFLSLPLSSWHTVDINSLPARKFHLPWVPSSVTFSALPGAQGLSLWCELKYQDSFIYKNSEDTFSSCLSLFQSLEKGGASRIRRAASGTRLRDGCRMHVKVIAMQRQTRLVQKSPCLHAAFPTLRFLCSFNVLFQPLDCIKILMLTFYYNFIFHV